MTNNENNNTYEGLSEDIKENLENCKFSDWQEVEAPKSLKEALISEIMTAQTRYEYLRGKFMKSLNKLHDLSRDREDESGVRAHDVANQIYDMEQIMAEAIGLYGRIFMLDNILSYIERKPNLANLIWKHRFPGSLSKSLYLDEDEAEILHDATRWKKIKKIMDKYEGLMPYVQFQSETMDSEDFYDEFIRRGKLRF